MIKRRYYLFVFLLLGFLCEGCSFSRSSYPLETSTATINSQTYPASNTPTINVAKRATAATPSTPTQASTSTQTAIPTLTNEEQTTAIKNLLETNSGCSLPCWWGLKPDVTPWDEANAFFLHLGLDTDYSLAQPNGIIIHSPEAIRYNQEAELSTQIYLFESNQKIESIEINTYFTANSYNQDLNNYWNNYSVKNIMETYGKPTKVLVFSRSDYPVESSTEVITITQYDLFIFYENLGFLFVYSGDAPFKSIYHLCPGYVPTGQIKGLSLYLQNQNSDQNLEEFSKENFVYESNALPIDKVSGITLDNFYQKIIQEGDSFCFDTPKNIWK